MRAMTYSDLKAWILDFVTANGHLPTLLAVRTALNLSKSTMSHFHRRLRKEGIELPKAPRVYPASAFPHVRGDSNASARLRRQALYDHIRGWVDSFRLRCGRLPTILEIRKGIGITEMQTRAYVKRLREDGLPIVADAKAYQKKAKRESRAVNVYPVNRKPAVREVVEAEDDERERLGLWVYNTGRGVRVYYPPDRCTAYWFRVSRVTVDRVEATGELVAVV